MRFLIRADASSEIGSGHLMRCLTLSDALAGEGHSCVFAMRDAEPVFRDLVATHGHELLLLASGSEADRRGELRHSSWLAVSQETDARQLLAALAEPVDWIVVDHYAIDHRWHRALRSATRRIMVIDDLADRQLDCDVLLDANVQEAPARYDGLTPKACQMLLGPRFALLRPEFAGARARSIERSEGDVHRVVISMGGADLPGATLLALEGVERAGLAECQVDVVAGPANPHFAAIQSWCADRANAEHHTSAELATLFARADLAIGAAGGTALERCCLGVPTILVTLAENQVPGAAALAREGAVILLGDVGRIGPDDIAAALRTAALSQPLRGLLRRNSLALVDGQGTRRVLRELLAPVLTLRPAAESDCEHTWRWRNAPETRRYSNDANKVALESHREWFAATLRDGQKDLLIGESAGEPVGVVRFDRTDALAVISIYLVPGRGGVGEGSALLRAALEWLNANRTQVATVEAEVLEANAASVRLFESAAFRPFGRRMRLTLQAPASGALARTPARP